jgi:hypothetical protein
MLDTQTLCARVTAPARAKPRSLYITASSKRWADQLRETGLADKTTTRVLTDAILAVVEHLTEEGGLDYIRTQAQAMTDEETTKVQLSVREDTWQQVETFAKALEMTPSHFVRVVCHVAMRQVINELTGR